LVSVITAVYNRADVVGEALASVQAQTYPKTEHIVVDGASTDGTLELIRSLAGESTVVVSEPDEGIYDALNKGLSRSVGDIVGLLHSDDHYADDRVLEDIVQVFSDQGVDGVYGDLDYVSQHEPHRVIRRWSAGSYRRDRLAWGWMPPHPTLFLRRQVFENLGGFDTSFRIAADYDAMLRFLAKGAIRLEYLPRVLVKMRLGGTSNGSISQIISKSREDYRALKKNRVGGVLTLAMKNISKVGQFI
jgi:glycosyltransferase